MICHLRSSIWLKRTGLALLLSTLTSHLSTCLAQGNLTPPGAPAPTMKSLDQIEPRTAVTNTGAFTISQPGSYYLTTNVSVSSGDAITIATSNVALDLNGFTISSTAPAASGSGILLYPDVRNVTMLNGYIQGGVTNDGNGNYAGGGFNNGITYTIRPPWNVRVSGISVFGCQYQGINLDSGNSTVVEFCTVRTVGNTGIVGSSVKSSSAYDCGGHGIFGVDVSDSRGQSSGSFYGVYGWCVMNCYGRSVFGTGIGANSAENCYGECNPGGGGQAGIYATTALNCTGLGHSGTGVLVVAAQNCYGESDSSAGVDATIAQNCCGRSTSGIGLRCDPSHGVATSCYGSSSTYVGVNAYIAVGCVGEGPSPISVSYKFNMP